MKIAILGIQQSGKKTLFSLLTGRSNILKKPGELVSGKSNIRDPRVDEIAKIAKPKKTTYAISEYVLCSDIDTKNRNDAWLKDARSCDLSCVVLRGFTSDSVFHPDGSVDLKRDKANIEMEMLFSDLDFVEKRLHRIENNKSKPKNIVVQEIEYKTLQKCKEHLEKDKMLNTLHLKEEEIKAINSLSFLTINPILWCLNVDEDRLNSDLYSDINEKKDNVFVVSALIEQEIMTIEDPSERSEYLNSLGLNGAGIDRLNAHAYDKLGLMSFYTMGPDEVRAWTIKKGSYAPQAGGKIHSDIERGFIRAEVFKYDDLMANGNEKAVKAAGKFQLKGKDYIIEDGDICNFLFNV